MLDELPDELGDGLELLELLDELGDGLELLAGLDDAADELEGLLLAGLDDAADELEDELEQLINGCATVQQWSKTYSPWPEPGRRKTTLPG